MVIQYGSGRAGSWIRVYARGFVKEGRLRESVRLGDDADGYDSLVVMSVLDSEYQARVALGLEELPRSRAVAFAALRLRLVRSL